MDTPGGVTTTTEQSTITNPEQVQVAVKLRATMGRMQAIDDYATGSNLTTFVGEGKHKDSKAFIRHTNYQNAERDLLRREAEEQTIRLMIGGAFRDDEIHRNMSYMV